MAGRPRTVTDDQILAATARAISRVGPHGLTLAAVAAEAGLAAPTLVQRFGSKRGLLLAFSRQASSDPAARFAAARDRHPSPLKALRAALIGMAGGIDTPEELANHLAFLQLELVDPDFREHVLAYANAMLAQIHGLLADAAHRGELGRRDLHALARAVYCTYNGALITWAVLREGTLTQWLGRELDVMLTSS
ncbi:TetR/AcrR family transcriptional regulator [Streptosporangiaceae bacterium NEAU-GS5]|nr:TetR/AcrR family transcriptional regulator [Streptosporangiaceae bacterium NEAU-GS5]